MAKLKVLMGLPASGKSTEAERIVEQGNWVRLNRDLLRTMLHFDRWSGKQESVTVDCEKALARALLLSGQNVVVDDTNLNPKNKEMWSTVAKECNAGFEYKHIETPWNECIERDGRRNKSVGPDVIIQMAMQYGLYPKPNKGFVICDLDGTICDISDRLHYVKNEDGTSKEKKDWKSFFEGIPNDRPRLDVVNQVKNFYDNGYDIIFVSARPDTYRAQTTTWLWEHITPSIGWVTLIMRHGGDKRPDTEVKKQIYETYFKDKYVVHCVIDDRPSVIRMWESNGLNVVNVGNNIEF